MENIDEMWSLFSTSLRQAISDCIPIKEVKMCQDSKPPWFDKDCTKATKKSRELYNKYRVTGDNFYHEQYKKIRREKVKKSYVHLKRNMSKIEFASPSEKVIISHSINILKAENL